MPYTVQQALDAGWKERAAEFAAYMRSIDRVLLSWAGVSHEDLADFDFAGAFLDERSPEEVAREMLEAEGFPMEEL